MDRSSEYEQLSAVLSGHLDEVTQRIIAAAIHEDTSDAADTTATAALGADDDG
jgi:hypothetical protein